MAIIDLVRWVPDGVETIYAWKFPHDNLSTYTQLIVHESQEAVLFSKGKLLGKFGPGKHTLSSENLPVLRHLYGFPFGGKNPFTAEVWFVNKLQPYNIDWVVDRMDVHDVDYDAGIPLTAKGKYGLKLIDAEQFLIKIVGTKNQFTSRELTSQFYGEYIVKTKSALTQFLIQNRIGLKQVSAYLDRISEHLKFATQPFWENIGFELTSFYVTNVEVDSSTEVGRRVLDAISRQSAQSIGGYTWQQSQMFEVAKDAIDGVAGGTGNNGLLGAIFATNMMGSMGGGGATMQPQFNQPNKQAATTNPTIQSNIAPERKEVFCSNCSRKFDKSLNFCPHCGDKYHVCPTCGTDNDEEAKRCVSCGTRLIQNSKNCKFCSHTLNIDANFCDNCGKVLDNDNCGKCNFKLDPAMKFCPKCGQKRS